ncbi:MAG: GatB/YqeY domain-containing protein [Flavobacteriales bacterium]|nr:GatB/YqeY domain-containing protein [Flavobacteriales bacterium]
MSLQERIDADIKSAMLAREKDRLNTLRAIKSAFMLELTKEGGQNELDDATGMKILQKLLKQRMESAAIYHAQDRAELAQEEEAQALVIERYLPKRMSLAEIQKVVEQVVGELGATSMADMGKVMGKVSAQLAGKADGASVAAIVKETLSG